jgi:acyl-coenzyme A synthetase/AMP-(fatty) acid ligase
MYINSLIKNRILENDFQIFDPKEQSIDASSFRFDYIKLRNYISNLSENSGVGIRLPKDHRYLMTMLACMEAGVFYVPMAEAYPQNRIDQIQEETDFTTEMNEELFSHILSSDQDGSKVFEEVEFDPKRVLYKICTSGSTGRPKAVVVQREAIEYFWKWVNEKFSNVKAEDRILQVTEFTFDISLIDVSLFLGRGGSLYFSGFTGNIFTLAYEIETYKITTLNTVVNNINMLLDDKVAGRADYSSIHTTMMGGARFSYGLYKKCKQHFKDIGVHNLYGLTEVPVYSHVKTMKFDETDLNEFTVSVGVPLGACTAIIVKDGKEVNTGERGEVLMGGKSMMKEYAKNPEKTGEVFTEFDGEKYYKSGDIGFQNESGDFFITGRMDDTIKYRGYRIDLLDIDSYILSRDYVQDAITVAIPDEEQQNITVCFLIINDERSVKEIKKDLSKDLLSYQIPEHLVFVKGYPTNINGKVCKKTLISDFNEQGKNK